MSLICCVSLRAFSCATIDSSFVSPARDARSAIRLGEINSKWKSIVTFSFSLRAFSYPHARTSSSARWCLASSNFDSGKTPTLAGSRSDSSRITVEIWPNRDWDVGMHCGRDPTKIWSRSDDTGEPRVQALGYSAHGIVDGEPAARAPAAPPLPLNITVVWLNSGLHLVGTRPRSDLS